MRKVWHLRMETKMPLCILRTVVSQLMGQSRPEVGEGRSLNAYPSPDISISRNAVSKWF